jgi:four helix bundle protein
MASYKDLTVWQKSIDLCEHLYKATESFPKSEVYGITLQIRKCSVSIPSSIAEGQRRGSIKEYLYFLRVAYGSGAELETQLIIAHRIEYIPDELFKQLEQALDEIMRMLNRLISALEKK